MKKNMGMPDRIVRFVLACMLLLYAWWQSSWIALGVSLFVFYEALASWCVLYQLIGRNTCPLPPHKKE
jgi:hypothetical protein